jgi:hypothetical protein
LRKLGFLTIGLFDEDDPRRGHESTLEIIELGERLGFDSAWVRPGHRRGGGLQLRTRAAPAGFRSRRAGHGGPRHRLDGLRRDPAVAHQGVPGQSPGRRRCQGVAGSCGHPDGQRRSSAEIAERLRANVAYQEIDEVAFALPFTFEHEDYVQILTDIAESLGPALGWSPSQ